MECVCLAVACYVATFRTSGPNSGMLRCFQRPRCWRRWRLRAVAAASLGGKSGRGGARGSCERKSCARAGRLVRGEWDGAGLASKLGCRRSAESACKGGDAAARAGEGGGVRERQRASRPGGVRPRTRRPENQPAWRAAARRRHGVREGWPSASVML